MHDVVVIGGGPGGLYTAMLLARDGFDVVVAEEHSVTGEPVHCTGVLASEAFSEFDIPGNSILNALQTARFFPPSGNSIAHTTQTTEAVVIDRALFDRGLQTGAEQAGAAIVLGARIASLDVTASTVTAHCTDGRTLRGRVAVLACGANYRLQKQLGLGIPSVYLRSAQMELPASRNGEVEVHFGEEVAPKGFAWVVPVDRQGARGARVGLMCEHDAATFFRRFLARIAPRWGIRTGAEVDALDVPRQKILPLAPIARTFADRVLAVGDAAGLVKATTGGGIYYSLVSAEAAARVLGPALKRDALGAAALKPYEMAWSARLGSELRAQLTLRDLAQRLNDSEINAFFELAHSNGVMPIVRQTARFNHHRKLIVSLLKHAPARRLLLKQLAVRTAPLSLQ